MSVARALTTRFADRFEIRAESGTGGMGAVYRAMDLVTGGQVALKVLHEARATATERFSQEAALLAELAHPAIVRYVDHGVTAFGEHYLAMEWLEGETLEERLSRGPIGALATVGLAKRVLEALAVAHQRGIVHRDLKPSNLFLPGSDLAQVKLLDFGIARRLFESRRLTMTGASLGTPAYMSPEQVRGARAVDARSDIFSLGCVLHECVAGEPPFAGETAMAVLAKICLDDRVDVFSRCPELPPELAAVIERMLSKHPTCRPASAAALASEVGEIAERLKSSRPETGPARRRQRGGSALATGERRVVSAILVARPDDIVDRVIHTKEPIGTWDVPSSVTRQVLSDTPDEEQLTRLRAAVAPFGARVDRFIGGAMVVTMAGQGTPTDQAAQAARCALMLKALLPEVALAVSTGRAVVDGPQRLGELIDGAARMLVEASPGSVCLDETTARLVEARFEVNAVGEGRQLLFEKALKEAPRTLLGREIPCVGRDRELGTLQAIFDECTNEPVARAVLVTAPAGGGKSRVRHELLDRIQARGKPFEYLVGRGESLRAGAPFGLLGPALLHAAGIVGGEALAIQQKRLAAHVARHVPLDQARRVAAFLGEMAGVSFPDDGLPALHAARQDPRLMADQMLAAWLDFLAAECAAHPVVLVLEDLHWGDAPSVQFVDAALRTMGERPLMVLAFARPEVEQRFPGLWSERDLQRMALPPLTARAAQKLARAALGELSPEQLDLLVERADGNPFFLEELLRALAAGGDASKLPDTVIGMVQARFDALGAEAKRVLRAAAVYGGTFRPAGVRALIPDEASNVGDWLEILAAREVIFPRQTGSGKEYAFRHALLQEAAYDMLTGDDRTLGHKLAGDYLEATGEPQAIVLVEHFERGEDRPRAALWCKAASEQALDANDLGAAIERVERGARLGAQGELLGAMRIVEATARFWRGEYVESERAARNALGLVTRPLYFGAVRELTVALGQQGHFDQVELWSERLLEEEVGESSDEWAVGLLRAGAYLVPPGKYRLVQRILDRVSTSHSSRPEVLGRLFNLRSYLGRVTATAGHGMEDLEEALRLLETSGNVRAATEIRTNLGGAMADMGLLSEAERHYRTALTTARLLDLAAIEVVLLPNLAMVVAFQGELNEARALAERGLVLAAAQHNPRIQGAGRLYLARIALQTGDHVAAVGHASTALIELADIPGYRAVALAVHARAILASGDVEAALEGAREANALLDSLGHVEDCEGLIRLVLAETLLAAGDDQLARAALFVASSRLHARAQSLRNPEWQQAFLKRVPEHAQTLALATRFEAT